MPESYTVQLTFRSAEETGPIGRDLLRDIATDVLDWATDREGTPQTVFPFHGEWTSNERGRFEASGEEDEELEYWDLDWFRPDSEGRRIDWLTQVRLATLGDEVEFRIRVGVRAQPGWITPEYASVKRPNVVPRLVTKFHATYYGDRVDALPVPVYAPEVGRFVNDNLNSPTRRMPLVVVSTSNAGQPLVPAKETADQLAGLAEVVALADSDAGWELTNLLGREWSCYGGAVRLYWPGFDSARSAPFDHRRWLPERIRAQGPWGVINHLFNTLCSRVARASGDSSLWDEAKGKINARAEVRTQNQLRKLGSDSELLAIADEAISSAERAREAALERAKGAESSADELAGQLTVAQQRIEALEDDLKTAQENLKATQREWGKTSRPVGGMDLAQEQITSVSDAVERASELPRLRFLPRVRKAAKASPYEFPSEVYEAFRTLDLLATERVTGSVGSIEEWLGQQGIHYVARESKTTRPKRWFTDNLKQERVLFEEHLKFGSDYDRRYCLRVQMAWDSEAGEWVIAHVGEHLDNTKTS